MPQETPDTYLTDLGATIPPPGTEGTSLREKINEFMARQFTSETPYGDPGFYAAVSSNPEDGGWIGFDLGEDSSTIHLSILDGEGQSLELSSTTGASEVTGSGVSPSRFTLAAGEDSASLTLTDDNNTVTLHPTEGLRFEGDVGLYFGAGSPEGAVTAPVGSLYMRSDGGAGTTLYVKESGTGDTGWVGK